MPKCLVPNCDNRYKIGGKQKHTRTKSFFQIPQAQKNPAKWNIARVWLDFCQIDIKEFQFQQHKNICEDHFEPHLIETIQQKIFPHGFRGLMPKRLKAGSVPTRNPPPGGPLRRLSDPDLDEKDAETLSKEQEESKEICEKIICQPASDDRKQVSDLARWPPNLKMPAIDLNPVLTCGICRGYFYNATTITQCLHTFCKACLVQHFYRSLHCPTCQILVHPSDPFCCMKLDSTLQDLVDKIFPEKCQEESIRELAFYRSRGLEPPNSGKDGEEKSTKSAPESRMVSVLLEYMGTSPHLPAHLHLRKKFLRIPDNVTIENLQKFLKMKMKLPLSSQAALFVNLAMLHGALTVRRAEEIFGKKTVTHKDLIVLQFGIVPKGDYFQQGIIMNTKDL